MHNPAWHSAQYGPQLPQLLPVLFGLQFGADFLRLSSGQGWLLERSRLSLFFQAGSACIRTAGHEEPPDPRTHLGREWYLLAGLPTPLTSQRVADLGMIFWYTMAW